MLTQYFDKEMDCLQVRQFVVISIYANAEEESRVTTIDNFVVAELTQTSITHSKRKSLHTHLDEV